MGKKSQTAKKKKRISKHVLNGRQQAESSKDGVDNDATSALTTTDKTPQQTSASKKEHHSKDPEEAVAYLHSWKASKTTNASSSSTIWKFNKNTQSWLIRHMYEVDKVPKNEFNVLMEYLEGLQGDVTKSRIVADATRRAKRYKEHAKKLEEEKAEADKDNDSEDDDDENEEQNTDDTTDKRTKKGTKKNSMTKEEIEYEENRWKKLSENDKRKEYKRARKVLDLIKL